MQNNTSGIQSAPFQSLLSSAQPDTGNIFPGRGNEILGQIFTDAFGEKHELGNYPQGDEEWQVHTDISYAACLLFHSSKLSIWAFIIQKHAHANYALYYGHFTLPPILCEKNLELPLFS